MDIGTAKPTAEERLRITHHFVDHVNPDEHFDAGLFGQEGRIILNSIFEKGKIPVVSGGSGLYIRSLIDGLFEGPKQDAALRSDMQKRITMEGAESLLAELAKADPLSAQKLLPTNVHRIMRALEVYYLTGIPISQLQKDNGIDIDFTPLFFGLNWDRKILYDRINKRTLNMIETGLIEEVKHLLALGYSKDLKSFHTVGYKEPIEYLEGKIEYEQMINLIQQYTRNYAKRQLTWFRADERITWLDASMPTDAISGIILNSAEELLAK
jgi:tRNA dimethylallyltransferase